MGVSSKQAIIFDFDGTLVDASEAICHSFNQALEKCELPRMDPRKIRAMIGTPLVGMFESVVEDSPGADVDLFVREYRSAFFTHSLVLTRLMPGVEETLTHFSSSVKLGIATSRRSDGAVHILKNFTYRLELLAELCYQIRIVGKIRHLGGQLTGISPSTGPANPVQHD